MKKLSHLVIFAIAIILLGSCGSKDKREAVFETYQISDDDSIDQPSAPDTIFYAVDTISIDTSKTAIAPIPSSLEIPVRQDGKSELIISHTGFTLSYNKSTNCPNWVAWDLKDSELSGEWGRSDDYKEDPDVPYKNRVQEYAFRGSGYDRGHMCPAADMHWSRKAMSDCFYMSNMCPQNPDLNQNWWERLESACRRWAGNFGVVYICCGPIYNKGNIEIIGDDIKVKVPTGFFKVVLCTTPGKEKAIGFLYKNNSSRQPMGDAACTVDDIEFITGYDFFPSLPDETEAKVESMCKLSKWN